LGVNLLVAVTSIFLLLTNQDIGLQVSNYGKVVVSVFVVLASAYLIFHIYKKEMRALKLCFWFCLLQIITIESESLTIGLSYGAKVGAVFEIGLAIVTINVLALLILLFTGKIIRGQKNLANC
jgi:hypothetical protein